MRTPRSSESGTSHGGFPSARHGYEQKAVDEYIRLTQERLIFLGRANEDLIAENQQLNDELARSTARIEQVDFSSLGGRARDILRLAEEQASEVLQRATQEADRLTSHGEADADRLRENAMIPKTV